MGEYYAVIRSGDTLTHYGVKGMKWGVRRALLKGNEKSLDRHFRKAAKKLKKLQDIGLNPAKYAAKSAAYGAAAVGTGTLAIGGARLFTNKLHKKQGALYNQAVFSEAKELGSFVRGNGFKTKAAKKLASESDRFSAKAASIDNWWNTPLKESSGPVLTKKAGIYTVKNSTSKSKLTRNDLLRLGSAAAALGLGAASGINAYRAKNSSKYRQKAVDFKNEMDKTFSGTKYSGQYVAPPKRRKRNK